MKLNNVNLQIQKKNFKLDLHFKSIITRIFLNEIILHNKNKSLLFCVYFQLDNTDETLLVAPSVFE